jgi:hypothetical protein
VYEEAEPLLPHPDDWAARWHEFDAEQLLEATANWPAGALPLDLTDWTRVASSAGETPATPYTPGERTTLHAWRSADESMVAFILTVYIAETWYSLSNRRVPAGTSYRDGWSVTRPQEALS